MGIAIFGILIIVTCLFALFLALNPKPYLELFIRPFGKVLYILAIVFTLFEIVLGFNILLLKEWARKCIVILNIIYMVCLFLTPLVQNKNFLVTYEQSFKQRLQQVSLEQIRRSEERKIKVGKGVNNYRPEQEPVIQTQFMINENMVRTAVVQAVLFIYGALLFWYLLLIFFFTRPKVKELFRQIEA
jgi:hypothetical protein